MSFAFIRQLVEAIDGNKILNSTEWKSMEQTIPVFAKDLKSLIVRQDYKRFVDTCNELFAANTNNQTSNLFPKLDRASWESLLRVLKYMKREEPSLVTGKKTDSVWNSDTMATSDRIRESLDGTIEKIQALLETIGE